MLQKCDISNLSALFGFPDGHESGHNWIKLQPIRARKCVTICNWATKKSIKITWLYLCYTHLHTLNGFDRPNRWKPVLTGGRSNIFCLTKRIMTSLVPRLLNTWGHGFFGGYLCTHQHRPCKCCFQQKEHFFCVALVTKVHVVFS